MPQPLLIDGPDKADFTILLAHGAGAPMDSDFMRDAVAALVLKGFRVARFEFSYMAVRRITGVRRPPPKAPTLMDEYRVIISELDMGGRVIIGGKSMGGRIASMIVDEAHAAGRAAGLLCLGYPFHPSAKPEGMRTAHLQHLVAPTLICQGSRDPFGSKAEVAGYILSPAIELLWLEGGDHDFRSRKTATGIAAADPMAGMAQTVRSWADALPA
jgi:uncharacterized protein